MIKIQHDTSAGLRVEGPTQDFLTESFDKEILERIFSYLDFTTLKKCERINTRFLKKVIDSSQWAWLLKKYFHDSSLDRRFYRVENGTLIMRCPKRLIFEILMKTWDTVRKGGYEPLHMRVFQDFLPTKINGNCLFGQSPNNSDEIQVWNMHKNTFSYVKVSDKTDPCFGVNGTALYVDFPEEREVRKFDVKEGAVLSKLKAKVVAKHKEWPFRDFAYIRVFGAILLTNLEGSGKIKVWDLKKSNQLLKNLKVYDDEIDWLSLHDRFLLTSSSSGIITIFDLKTILENNEPLLTCQVEDTIYCMALCKGFIYFVLSSDQNTLHAFDCNKKVTNKYDMAMRISYMQVHDGHLYLGGRYLNRPAIRIVDDQQTPNLAVAYFLSTSPEDITTSLMVHQGGVYITVRTPEDKIQLYKIDFGVIT